MDRADRDRSAQASPGTSGALGISGQAPGTAGARAGKAATHRSGAPSGQEPDSAPPAVGPFPGAGPARRRSAPGAGHTQPPGHTPPPGDGLVRRWLRRAGRRPAVRQGALLLCFVAIGIAMTWPRVTYFASVAPLSRDSASYVWGFWWVAHQVTHLGNPWFTPLMAAPVGVQIGFHTLMPLPGLLMMPLTLTAGPVLSYNLMVVVVPGLLAYAMYRAARLWLRSATAAVAAGAFFGFSSMLTQQAWYHVNIAAGAIFLPLALEASVRLRRNPGRRQALILGVVMGAAVLTDQESAVLAAIVTALALVPWLIRRHAWAALRPAALAVAAGAVIASPQVIAMIWEVSRGGLGIDPHTLAVSYKQYGIGLPGMFSPTPRVSDFGLGVLAQPFLHGRDNEGMPMFGTVLTALAVAGIVAAWRRRGTWLLAGLWGGCAVLALGTSLWVGKHQYLPLASSWNGVQVSDIMPYTWFVRIPGLSSFREADRLAILGMLPAALLAGAAVDWLRYHARAVLVVILALGVLEAGYSGTPRVGHVRTATYARVDTFIAADSSHSIVLDFPFGLRGGIPEYGVPFFAQALYMATLDGHPRSIAYTSRLPYTTRSAIQAHPFYGYLADRIQHETLLVCPWRVPRQPASVNSCVRPYGVALRGIGLSPEQLAAARRDARRMHVEWVVVWKRNPSVAKFVLPYLTKTGFTWTYRVGNVLVYWHQSCSLDPASGFRACLGSGARTLAGRSAGHESALVTNH